MVLGLHLTSIILLLHSASCLASERNRSPKARVLQKGKTRAANRFHPNLPPFGQHLTRPYESCKELEQDIVRSLRWEANFVIEEELKRNTEFCFSICGRGGVGGVGGGGGGGLIGCGASVGSDETVGTGGPDAGNGGDNIGADGSRRMRVIDAKTDVENLGNPKTESRQDSFNTNNQVKGVDEADTVKSDGKYIFVVYSGQLYMISLNGEIVDQAEIGDRSGVLLLDASAKVITTVNHGHLINVVDVWSYQNEKLEKRTSFELFGDLIAARSIDSKVQLITVDDGLARFGTAFVLQRVLTRCKGGRVDMPLDDYETWAFNEAKHETVRMARSMIRIYVAPRTDAEPTEDDCRHVLRISTMENSDLKTIAAESSPLGLTRSFVRLVSFDMSQPKVEERPLDLSVAGFFTRGKSFKIPFMSTKHIIFFLNGKRSANLIAFEFLHNNTEVIPRATGVLEGSISDRFSINYSNGLLRVGSKSSDTGRDRANKFPLVSNLLVDNEEGIKIVGQYRGGKSRSSTFVYRFVDNSCYILNIDQGKRFLVAVDMNPDTPVEVSKTRTGLDLILNFVTEGDSSFILGLGQDSSGDYSVISLLNSTDASSMREIHQEKLTKRGRNSFFKDGRFKVGRWQKRARYDQMMKRLVLPVQQVLRSGRKFRGFVSYKIDQVEGIVPIKKVKHDPDFGRGNPRSLFLSGNLITWKKDLIKCTKSAGSSQKDWNLKLGRKLIRGN